MQATGVTLVVVVALAVLATAALAFSSSPVDIRDDYLPLSSVAEGSGDSIAKVLTKDIRAAGLAPKTMLEEFAKLRESADPASYELVISNSMYKLAAEGPEGCHWAVRNDINEILAFAKHNPSAPASINYINYLRSYGKNKFTECVADLKQQFKYQMFLLAHPTKLLLDGKLVDVPRFVWEAPPTPFLTIEAGFDLLVAAAHHKRNLNHTELYELAMKTDLANDDLDARRMLKKMDKFVNKNKPAKNEKEFMKSFRKFMRIGCDELGRGLNELFGRYNMAVVLGSQLPGDVPVRFLKLNEYNRICLAWAKNNKAEENISRQFRADSHKWYKLGGF